MARASNLGRYQVWLSHAHGVRADGYESLRRWSVDELEAFWKSIWDYYHVRASQPADGVLTERSMPGARWFPGARLNYAEHCLRHPTDDRPAIVFAHEDQEPQEISWQELRRQVGSLATALRREGVQPGDRVVAYMPNIPQTVIALLGAASIGAVWAACSPDLGTGAVIDRLAQLKPTVLIAVDGYQFAGKAYDRRAVVAELERKLPTIRCSIHVANLFPGEAARPGSASTSWDELVGDNIEPQFEQVDVDHPLWVLFSSGTTGAPKGIVHGHGGMLVEHLKALGLGCDLRPDDRYFFFSSTSWMVWNFLVAGLMHGTTIVLYDGSPGHPDLLGTWRIAERTEATIVGAGAAYLSACAKAAIEPGRALALGRVRQIISTGSPLPASAWNWAYKSVGPDIWLQSLSGGTDICSAFAGGSPMLPVHAGEIACRWLGVALNAWDPSGRPLVNAVGELVVTEPMPSMPIRFWNDPDGSRYRAAYFENFPGIWRHGDWVTVSSTGAITISGRSDSTLNRQGVRMGSADIYTIVEALAEVADSLVVGVELPEGEYWMPLFVVPAEDIEFGPELQDKIKHAIRDRLSPRHVPDEIVCAPAVPRTLTGKKLEVPIKRILQGAPLTQVANQDSIDNAAALQWYAEIGERRLEAAAEPQTC